MRRTEAQHRLASPQLQAKGPCSKQQSLAAGRNFATRINDDPLWVILGTARRRCWSAMCFRTQYQRTNLAVALTIQRL
eukprot:3034800-Amphidinium_carterae.1